MLQVLSWTLASPFLAPMKFLTLPFKIAMYVLTLVACLVEGCLARAQKLGRLREHFMYRHWKANIAILQEVPPPLPQFTNYSVHIPAAKLEIHK